jgi:hypothetical protein
MKALLNNITLLVLCLLILSCTDQDYPEDGTYVFINNTGKDLKIYVGVDSTFSKKEIKWTDSISIESKLEFKRRKKGFQSYPFGGNRMKVLFSDGKEVFFNDRNPGCKNDPECNNSQNPFYNRGKPGPPINAKDVVITYIDSLYLLAK